MTNDGRFTTEYLIIDAGMPLISNDILKPELLLYNIDTKARKALFAQYLEITGKQLSPETAIATLSGGQKVILMILLALHSPAQNIRFVNIMQALDKDKRSTIQAKLKSCQKNILIEDRTC